MTEQDQEEISTALNAINDCLVALGKRLEAVEKHVSEMPTPDKTYYKPKGEEDYLNIKGNYDLIYKRLEKFENGM